MTAQLRHGPRTAAAVRVFQEGVAKAVPSFPVDGIVGPLTWQALTWQALTGQALTGQALAGGMLAD